MGEIWVLPLEGERKPQVVLANQFDHRGAAFSPDGKYLAYVSNETGRYELYVMPFRNGSGKWQISTNGGGGAIWERGGKELFYLASGNIMGVDIATQPTFHASTPRVIVPSKALGNLAGRRGVSMIDSTGHPSPELQIREDRYYAAHLLGDLKDSRAVPILIPLKDQDINWIVPWSLGEIGDKSVIPPLIETLGENSPDMRVLAIYALEKLNAKEALPQIRGLLNDDERIHFDGEGSVADAAKAAIATLEKVPDRSR